jgi:hypothetical protein
LQLVPRGPATRLHMRMWRTMARCATQRSRSSNVSVNW